MKKTTEEETYKPKHAVTIHITRKKHRWIWIITIIISFFIILFAIIKIISWNKDNEKIKNQMDVIEDNLKVEEVLSDENTEQVNPPTDKDNDYWNYMKLPLLSVDFNELKQINKETIAFLKVDGTNINYPVVQTKDNDYYLKHSFDKTKNDAGWVFMDYRNDIENLQDNTIIYAHGRYDTTMFGSLKNVFKNNWYENTDNHVIYLSTPKENTLWQVFSVYSIKTETYYLTSSFGSEETHKKFINTIKTRSKYDFKTDVTTKDKILTLSTCYNQKEKVVLHAKLIKRQKR